MTTTYTELETEAALCVWEHVLECFLSDDAHAKYWRAERAIVGTATLRLECVEIGRKINLAYNVLNGGDRYPDPFDWELVPNVLVALRTPRDATYLEIRAAVETEIRSKETMTMKCLYCADDRIDHLGALGTRDHYRCKACGGQFSKSPRNKQPFPRKGGGTYTALDPAVHAREEHIRNRIKEGKR